MRDKIDKDLGNWDKATTELKKNIYEATVNQVHKKRNFTWKPVLAFITLLLVGFVSYLLVPSTSQNEPDYSSDEGETTQVELLGDVRVPNDLTLEITKYEYFYHDPSFYSKIEVEHFALSTVIQQFELVNHLQGFGVVWPDDQRDHYRNRAKADLETLKENESFLKYYLKLQQELNITDEDYIEHYLLPQYEVNVLRENMFSDGIGLDKSGAYPKKFANKEFLQRMGLPENALEEKWEELNLAENKRLNEMKYVENPNVPFDLSEIHATYAMNQQGEIIFAETSYLSLLYNTQYATLMEKLVNDEFKSTIYRSNLDEFLSFLRNYETANENEANEIQEIIEIYEMLKRSIDWEL